MGILTRIAKYMKTVPVDVYEIARECDISVTEKDMDDKISGKLENKNGKFHITVNAHHSENRRRFTILHEIGHWLFHRDLIGDGIIDNKAFRSTYSTGNPKIKTSHEIEANRFAASVLMPADLIMELENKGITKTSDLAKRLKVSEAALEIRRKYI